LTLGRYIPEGV